MTLYARAGQLIAQSWPRARKRRRTLAERERETQLNALNLAHFWWEPRDLESIRQASADIPVRSRDVVTALASGTLFEIHQPDGTVLYPQRFNLWANGGLDLIGDLHPSTLSRNSVNWFISRGCPGMVLTTQGKAGAYWLYAGDVFLS